MGGCLPLTDGWGWSLRICVSGAALWWFMYRFRSPNQKESGKTHCQVWGPSLLTGNGKTTSMFPAALPAGCGRLSGKKINQLFQSLLAISHHPDGRDNDETATRYSEDFRWNQAFPHDPPPKLVLLRGSRLRSAGAAAETRFALKVMMEKLSSAPATANWKILLAGLDALVPPHVLCGGGKASQIHLNVFFTLYFVSNLELEADNRSCIRMVLSCTLSCFTLTRPPL